MGGILEVLEDEYKYNNLFSSGSWNFYYNLF